MKSSLKLPLFLTTGIAILISGCASNETKATAPTSSNTSQAAIDYCIQVGGEISSVDNGQDNYCLLPTGDVVEAQSFYQQNH